MSLPEVISIVQSHLRRYCCLFDYIHAILLFAEQSLVKFLWMTKATQITGVVLPVHAIAHFSAIRQKTFAPGVFFNMYLILISAFTYNIEIFSV